jgi:hypothetical protein
MQLQLNTAARDEGSIGDLETPDVCSVQRNIDLEWEICKPAVRLDTFLTYLFSSLNEAASARRASD